MAPRKKLARLLDRLEERYGTQRPPSAKTAFELILWEHVAYYLALESNGLRVLVCLGWGEEAKSYPVTYRSAQAAAEPELAATCPARVCAHLLLRRHGQETCKHSAPHCDECPIAEACAFFTREG